MKTLSFVAIDYQRNDMNLEKSMSYLSPRPCQITKGRFADSAELVSGALCVSKRGSCGGGNAVTNLEAIGNRSQRHKTHVPMTAIKNENVVVTTNTR